MKMLTTIQAGRALAAIAVSAFHLSIMMGLARYGGVPVLQDWTNVGHLGVDYFFVLSGFVILMAHYDDIGQPRMVGPYVWKRFVRVYPIYLLYTAVFVALVFLGFGNNTPLPHSLEGWLSALTLVRFSQEAPPIAPAWTLFHEVFFYAVFSILIWNRLLGLAVLVIWIAACLMLWQYPPEDGRIPVDVYLSAYCINFILGMLVYLIFRFMSDRWQLMCTVGLFGVAILVVAHLVSKESPPRLAWACGFSSILFTGIFLESKFKIHAPRWLRYIGDSSYSLYLLHIPLQGLLLKILIKTEMTQSLDSIVTYVAVLICTIILSCLAYKLIEFPLLQALRMKRHVV